jgi:hypothetical protein
MIYALGRPIACFVWSSAPRHLRPRDRFIGWTPEIRRRHLHLIVYNPRFLILPWVHVPHLASHLLGRMVTVLARDWERLYGHPIYFLETFVDPARFRGTCYRAANWVVLRAHHRPGEVGSDASPQPADQGRARLSAHPALSAAHGRRVGRWSRPGGTWT